MGMTCMKVNGSWALFYVVNMPNFPQEISSLIGSSYLLKEEAIGCYHQRTMVTTNRPIRFVSFCNSKRMQKALALHQQTEDIPKGESRKSSGTGGRNERRGGYCIVRRNR